MTGPKTPRDLAADLAVYRAGLRALCDPSHDRRTDNRLAWELAKVLAADNFGHAAERALAAEAEVERLRAVIDGLVGPAVVTEEGGE